MIDRSEVDAAVAAATRSLAEEPGVAWIKQSGLLERAYFLGLYGGLSGIASEEDVRHILVRVMIETWSMRRADDTFQSTKTGILFDSVRRELYGNDADRSALLAAIQRLADHIDELDSDWNSRLKRTRMLLEAVGDSSQPTGRGGIAEADTNDRERRLCAETRRQAEELEFFARHFALVETDHRTWRRLED